MKRRTIITIIGQDDDMDVNIEVDFYPPFPKREPPSSGWVIATTQLIEAIKGMRAEQKDVSITEE